MPPATRTVVFACLGGGPCIGCRNWSLPAQYELQQVMTPSTLYAGGLHILPSSFLFKKRLFGFTPYLLIYYFGALGWQTGLSARFPDFFFSTGISYIFSRGIEKTLKRPSGRVRNYPSFGVIFYMASYWLILVSAPILPPITAFQFCGGKPHCAKNSSTLGSLGIHCTWGRFFSSYFETMGIYRARREGICQFGTALGYLLRQEYL